MFQLTEQLTTVKCWVSKGSGLEKENKQPMPQGHNTEIPVSASKPGLCSWSNGETEEAAREDNILQTALHPSADQTKDNQVSVTEPRVPPQEGPFQP